MHLLVFITLYYSAHHSYNHYGCDPNIDSMIYRQQQSQAQAEAQTQTQSQVMQQQIQIQQQQDLLTNTAVNLVNAAVRRLEGYR